MVYKTTVLNLSNSWAYVMVVVCPSICRLSVMDVLWLNSARQGMGCYWSVTGSHIFAFKWHENRWLWMTLKCYNTLWYANRAVLWLNGKS